MTGNWIFIPEGIDLPSSIIWGIATAAIGGILVELARSNLSSNKAFSRSLLIFIVSGFIWLAYYNVPFYSYFFYGDLKSGVKDDCSAAYSNWIHANELQPTSGLPYLRIGKCLDLNHDYDRAIQWLEAGKGFRPQNEILTELGISYFNKNDYSSATKNFQEALKHDSENFNAQLLLGICLHTQGNVKDS